MSGWSSDRPFQGSREKGEGAGEEAPAPDLQRPSRMGAGEQHPQERGGLSLNGCPGPMGSRCGSVGLTRALKLLHKIKPNLTP